MTIEELRDYLIDRGIKSVKKTETGSKQVGGIEGFEMCRSLNTPDDFIEKLESLRKKGKEISNKSPNLIKEKKGLYWQIRYQALQIEFVFERLKCAWKFSTLSARATLDYSEILNKKDK